MGKNILTIALGIIAGKFAFLILQGVIYVVLTR